MKKYFHLLILISGFSLFFYPFGALLAETIDFGGYPERFKGGGDKIPPRCQLDAPTSAGEPFFVKWHCTDDNAEEQELRTELWIYRRDSLASEKVAGFLGFPAAAWIDRSALKVEEFSEGFPFSMRLVAIDRAGITTISPLRTVFFSASGVTQCNLNIQTSETESDEETTGTPAMLVTVTDADVETQQLTSESQRIITTESATADPCEIDDICKKKKAVDFALSFSDDTSGNVSGTLSITPGDVLATMSGSASRDEDGRLTSISVTGPAIIDDKLSDVELSCGTQK